MSTRWVVAATAVAVAVLPGGLARADKAKPVLTAAQKQQYAKALQHGRQLESKKDYAGAIAAFDEALVASPDDPVALSEAGLSAYLAHDLARAEKSTRAALTNQAGLTVRGATLYNLGLIELAKGDKAAAIAAYRESLHARPNATVLAKLAKLDANAAAAFGPFATVYLAGPFKSVADYCKTLPATEDAGPDWSMSCACGAPIKPSAQTLAAPWLDATVFARSCSGTPTNRDFDAGHVDYKVGVRLAGGWYVQDLEERTFGRNCNEGDFAMTYEAHAGDAAGPQSLVVTTTNKGTCWHADADWTDTALVAIGLGASKVPSAVRVETKHYDRADGELSASGPGNWSEVVMDYALDATWSAGGTLTLAGKTTVLDKATAASLVGAHKIAFP